MRKIGVVFLLFIILVFGSMSLIGCSNRDTDNFDNLQVSVDSRWFINQEGYFCLGLTITNNSDATINDIQASYFWEYKNQDEAILGSNSVSGATLYRYDTDGYEIRGHPKMNIKPGETFSCIAYKVSRHDIAYQFDINIYITWVDFSKTANWGTRNLVDSEQNLASKAPQIDVHPITQVS
ncbi:MAG: hypothetical protein FWF37_02465 [Chloroflexi bacterium]|nr:hypothetical protein [Chloroflexota bacterium]